jgi:hypothetical protein
MSWFDAMRVYIGTARVVLSPQSSGLKDGTLFEVIQ